MDRNNFRIDFRKALTKDFFLRDTVTVARELIDAVLVRNYKGIVLAGQIVETEAYLSNNDLSCHAFAGKTKRNAPMFEAGGILYVYKIYGVHHCINFVSEQESNGAAVLIRALKPILGIDTMMKLRNNNKLEAICKGPGNLAKAFGFTLKDNYKLLTESNLFVQLNENIESKDIAISRRIGITKSSELPLRFYLKNSEFVSKIR